DDKIAKLEEQFEQFSITTMQDTYQLKKRIKILEEEILSSNVQQKSNQEQNMRNVPDSVKHKHLLIQKVYNLHQHGYSNNDINQQTALSEDDIQTILNNQN